MVAQATMARARTFQRPGRNKPSGPDPIDVRVGSRVRLRRNMLALSQEKLGDALGLTFQQVQKYERGANRVSASRLYQLSRVLDVPVRFFYDEVDPVRAPAIPGGFAEPPAASYQSDPLGNPETRELIEAYFTIADATVRQRLFHLARALAQADEPNGGAPAPRRRGRQHRT
jgi:transcriptional regulator with XRE-family HTH domain